MTQSTAQIRLARVEDAESICSIYAPSIVGSAISFEMEVPDEAEMAGRIQRILHRYPWLVCEMNGAVAGYVYAGPHRDREAYQWTTEVTVYVHKAYTRKGIARALYTTLLALLREQGFVTALAGVTVPNSASTNFHRSMGFEAFARYEKAGYKMDRWHTTEWYQMVLRSGFGAPPVLRLVEDVWNSEAGQRAVRKGLRMLTDH